MKNKLKEEIIDLLTDIAEENICDRLCDVRDFTQIPRLKKTMPGFTTLEYRICSHLPEGFKIEKSQNLTHVTCEAMKRKIKAMRLIERIRECEN